MQFEIDYKLSLGQLISDTLLLCYDPLGERYPAARVTQALNDTALDFCLETRIIKQTANITLYQDKIYYNIKEFAEERSYLKAYGFPIRVAFNGQENQALWPTSLFEIDLFSESQITQAGPYRWHIDSVSPGTIVVYGRPSEEGYEPTTFEPDSDNLLLRQITQEGDILPYDNDLALRDIDGVVSFVIRDNEGNIVRLITGVTEDNNLQVTYIALPDEMVLSSDTPDTIPAKFHNALTYGAAARLLEEGNEQDFTKAIEFEAEFKRLTRQAIAEIYREETQYDSATPA